MRELVTLHGGAIEAHSAGLGMGSEFILRLPLIATPQLRVLVADDNIDAAQALSMLLEMVGHEVRMVHDGPAVLKAVDDFEPAVILLDIGLPGMDGYPEFDSSH